MSSILIDYVRISGLRGLKDFEMPLKKTTVLTGVNNVGKTTILKALQISLGSRTFLESEDFHITKEGQVDKIVVDIRIVPADEDGLRIDDFSEDWESIFKVDRIQIEDEKHYVPLRTVVSYDPIGSVFKTEQTVLNQWDPADSEEWRNIKGKKQSFFIEEMPFFYEEAQRDIVDDMKLKSSFVGKMLSDVSKSYEQSDIEALEDLISDLNQKAIEKSEILSTLQDALSGVASTMDNSESVDISPFSKKVRDLNKTISIHYGENEHSFAMEYHGMGTRSWSSLLTLKAFVIQNKALSSKADKQFFPIIAIEEPEAHLHPNAQKKLYKQISEIPGQKIISTHSQFIAASANIDEVVGLYKNDRVIKCGHICSSDLDAEELRKLRQKVINTKGEVFFSKALVLFEGETEEQALPVFAEKFFGCHPNELGIDLIGVGGAGQYFPFIRFANDFNIPWYIFSDGEKRAQESMKNAIIKVVGSIDINAMSNVFVIDNCLDFEGQLIQEEYIGEIVKVLSSLNGDDYILNYVNDNHGKVRKRNKTGNICSGCNQYIYSDEINDYKVAEGDKKALLHMMYAQKTKFGLEIAQEIVKSSNSLPTKVSNLFTQIKTDLGL